MLFKPNRITLPTIPHLVKPIENEDLLYTCQITQFDREGYELLPIEQEYYRASGIGMHNEKVFAHESGNPDGWSAVIQRWFEQVDSNSPYVLDHSFCVVRYSFEGEAKKQIQRAAKKRPELSKLLHIKPKWGHDFCVDYVQSDHSYELVHWEWDYRNFEEFDLHRDCLEIIVQKTDWEAIHQAVKTFRICMPHAEADVEGNFKTNMFGLHKAFRLFKSF